MPNNENLKQLVAQGLAAMHAGSGIAARATDEISSDVTHPKLKAVLVEGNRTSKQWADRITRARAQVGDGMREENPVVEAHYEVSRRIREHAPDSTTRDLGIIADSQFALHYWTAAFGTMATYTKALGLEDIAAEMKASAEDAKRGDEACTETAKEILASA